MKYKYWLGCQPKDWGYWIEHTELDWTKDPSALRIEVTEEQVKKWFPKDWDKINNWITVKRKLKGIEATFDFKKFYYYIDKYYVKPDPDARPLTDFMSPEKAAAFKARIKEIEESIERDEYYS